MLVNDAKEKYEEIVENNMNEHDTLAYLENKLNSADGTMQVDLSSTFEVTQDQTLIASSHPFEFDQVAQICRED